MDIRLRSFWSPEKPPHIRGRIRVLSTLHLEPPEDGSLSPTAPAAAPPALRPSRLLPDPVLACAGSAVDPAVLCSGGHPESLTPPVPLRQDPALAWPLFIRGLSAPDLHPLQRVPSAEVPARESGPRRASPLACCSFALKINVRQTDLIPADFCARPRAGV